MLSLIVFAAAVAGPTLDPHPAIAVARVSVTILRAERINFRAIPPKHRVPGEPERRVVDFE
jgi:hypothetical protein